MIPKLFTKDDLIFTTEGLGRLVDVKDCRVVCSIPNMTYELELTYLKDGPLYDQLVDGAQIVCDTYYGSGIDVFDVYSYSILIDGSKRVRARHQSYRLISYHCFPFAATNDKEAVANIVPLDIIALDWSFVFRGSTPVENPLEITKPVSIRNAFSEIKETYGGYVWFEGKKAVYLQENATYIGAIVYDNALTFLCDENGAAIVWDDADGAGIQDRGAEIRHRKDMTSMEWVLDNTNVYTRVLAWWSKDGYKYYAYSMDFGWKAMPESLQRNYLLDVSNDYEAMDQQTIQQIANQYAITHWQMFVPAVTVNVGANDMPDSLERVRPLDYVTLYHESLPSTFKERMTGWTWDPIRGKYLALTIGQPIKTLADKFAKVEKEVEKAQEEDAGDLLYVINCGMLPHNPDKETYVTPNYWEATWDISASEDSAILAAASGGKVILQGYLSNYGGLDTPIELSASGYAKKLNVAYGASVISFPSTSSSYMMNEMGEYQLVDSDLQSDDFTIYQESLNYEAEIRNYGGSLTLTVRAWEDMAGRPYYLSSGYTEPPSEPGRYTLNEYHLSDSDGMQLQSALKYGCPIMIYDLVSTGTTKRKKLDEVGQVHYDTEYYRVSFLSERQRYYVSGYKDIPLPGGGYTRIEEKVYLDDDTDLDQIDPYDETIIGPDGKEYTIHHDGSPPVHTLSTEVWAEVYGNDVNLICDVTNDDEYKIKVMTEAEYSQLTQYEADVIYHVTEDEDSEEEETDYIYKTITVGGKDYEVVDWDAMRERDGEETP